MVYGVLHPNAKTMSTLEKRGRVFLLTLTGDGEHRLSPALLDSLEAALRRIRSDPSHSSSALVTAAHGKFFSNGFDLTWARSAPASDHLGRMEVMSFRLHRLLASLFSLPMPTIAAVSGHAAAAGYMLAISHDYVLMRRDRGFIYMSELDLGLRLPDYFVVLMRAKIGAKAAALRDVALRAEKIGGSRAEDLGIVDAAYDGAEEVVAAALRLGEELAGRGWSGELYAWTRRALFPEVCQVLELKEDDEKEMIVPQSRL